MLNVGSVREKERLILHGVPWHVDSINVFCSLVNPALEIELRIPIEDLIGMVSRPYNPAEPWFPCKKGDWVVVNGAPRARVVSLSHEQVEVVERGGKRITYPTEIFLEACPVNLSRNFRLRVPFGISYGLQKLATSEIPMILKDFLMKRMEQERYQENCLNLQVEFSQANSSSLDLLVLADFEGQVADISKRIERAINKWCVECCTINDWEIPFPQLTVHRAS
jgi:small-conductance mechanosensitive channel